MFTIEKFFRFSRICPKLVEISTQYPKNIAKEVLDNEVISST